MNILKEINGQAMILTILALGGTLLGATTIAGLLMLYQIRQATDLANSNKAILAADAGIEWADYLLVTELDSSTVKIPLFSNQATKLVLCYDVSLNPVDCSGRNPVSIIRSFGQAGEANRWLEQSPPQQSPPGP